MELTDYKVQRNPLGELTCVDLLDFRDYPVLTLERSKSGQDYLSYLVTYLPGGKEQRLVVSASAQRLLDLRMGIIPVRSLYEEPASGPVYAFEVDEETGSVLDSYLIPLADFQPVNPVPADYVVYCPPAPDRLDESAARSLAIAKDRHRVVLDLYAQGEALAAGVRPWTISHIFQPVVELVQKAFNLPEAQFNKVATFPRFAFGSFEATIELNYGDDLFGGALELPKFNTIIDLINARSAEEFHGLVSRFPNEAFIKQYLTFVNAVKKHDLTVEATLANPMSEEVCEANLNRRTAEAVRNVINAAFDEIVDVEDVEGVFLDLDFSVKPPRYPSFTVLSLRDNMAIRGKIADELAGAIRSDRINLTRTSYVFTIKTVYQPETLRRPERTQKWLIGYAPLAEAETTGAEE